MADLLGKLLDEVHQGFVDGRTILSFAEYFRQVEGVPRRHFRSSAQYLVDAIDYFGTEKVPHPMGEVTRFRIFDAAFAGGEGRVVGQEVVLERLYQLLSNFAREGRVNKLILLHGPNGSAKSSMVRCLTLGLEAYAETEEGALYSFNWVFPASRMSTERIGFGSDVAERDVTKSFAYLTAENIDARVPCDLHDHPLFLLPRRQRQALCDSLCPGGDLGACRGIPDRAIRSAVEPAARSEGDVISSICGAPSDKADGQRRPNRDGSEFPDRLLGSAGRAMAISDYLRSGDLCYKCRRIYDALLASYDGDASEVLKHVQIERFFLSRRYRRGAATIEPQAAVDARIQQITADKSLGSLPKALQHISLYEPTGPLVDANRGLLEYSDLLKRPVEAFKYLLATIETASVSMDSFVLHLDLVFLASTNETYLDAFKEHPDFPSFKGRMELLKVPYLLQYGLERQIYLPQITSRIVGRHVAPHAIDVAALWGVLTRMRRCDPARYGKDLTKVIDTLSPMEKLRLYDTGALPERLSSRQGKELHHVLAELYRESMSYPNYEGRFGASARELRTALLNAAHHEGYACLSPLAVFEQLEEILAATSVYEFLTQDAVSGYHDHKAFLKLTRDIYLDWADDEIRESMGLATAESYVELFGRYITHISHWVKKEKLHDPASGQYRDADEKFMGEIERVLLAKGETATDFRKAVISTIGAKALDNPDAPQAYGELFSVYVHRLREDFYTKRRAVVRKMNEVFLKYTSDERAQIDAKTAETVEHMLQKLKDSYGYCVHCSRDTVAFLLKTKYAE